MQSVAGVKYLAGVKLSEWGHDVCSVSQFVVVAKENDVGVFRSLLAKKILRGFLCVRVPILIRPR
jgi:hypothetical protein